MPSPYKAGEKLYDALSSFPGGVNEGLSALDLSAQVMAGAINVTVRGNHATHRSSYHKRKINWESDATKTAVNTGRWQGGCYYFGDDQEASLLAFISGRLFWFTLEDDEFTCREVTITGGIQGANQPQAWLWQAEKWAIIQDGISNPIFFNGTLTATRSNYSQPINYSTTTASEFAGGAGIPAVNQSGDIDFTDVTNLVVGDVVTFLNIGMFQVQAIVGATVTLLNLTATPVGKTDNSGVTVSWVHQGAQLPPGRMGAYGMGRNWISLVDGKQFVASDIVGGASGTVANNFRDAVLNITENLFLRGGGNFTVPGSVGDIKAMRFVATLDASLGQGPLQVFTHNTVFSCQTPVDRLTWQTVTNPILTESLISNGALGQNSTVLANGDVLFRSIDGVRSLILARRDFSTWGNVPISREVCRSLNTDDPGLLTYGSAIVFDNRLLMTVGTTSHAQGVYFQALIPLNFDPLSSLRGKAPSVWDAGLWTGLNTLQLVTGEFDGVQRAFSFVLNLTEGLDGIELWEILPSYDPTLPAAQQPRAKIYDNDLDRDIPIIWQFDSHSMRFGVPPNDRVYMRLLNGELWVGDVQGQVLFQVKYRPDQYPCWVNWHQWNECQSASSSESKPGFRPRMGFGSPSSEPCEGSPLCNGFTFQTRLIIQGHCVINGIFFEAVSQPMPVFAPRACDSICNPVTI